MSWVIFCLLFLGNTFKIESYLVIEIPIELLSKTSKLGASLGVGGAGRRSSLLMVLIINISISIIVIEYLDFLFFSADFDALYIFLKLLFFYILKFIGMVFFLIKTYL